MIMPPNRLAEAVQAIERGESVDWNRIALLQPLDLVLAGRKFVEEAIQSQEREDDKLEQFFTPPE